MADAVDVLQGELRLAAGCQFLSMRRGSLMSTNPTPPRPTSAARAPAPAHLLCNHAIISGLSTKSGSGANGTVEKASGLCFSSDICQLHDSQAVRFQRTTRSEVEIHHSTRPTLWTNDGVVSIDGSMELTRHRFDRDSLSSNSCIFVNAGDGGDRLQRGSAATCARSTPAVPRSSRARLNTA